MTSRHETVNWRKFAKIAMGVLNVSPVEFWNMTPSDFWLIHDGRVEVEKAKRPRRLEPMTLKEFHNLERNIRIIHRERGVR